MKKLLFVGLVLLISTSCTDNVEKSQLTGVWIETTHKTDTLVFDNQSKGFILNRGKELRDGYLLPKIHSGPYFYEIKGDSISLIWSASNYNKGFNYFYKLDNLLKIGNFYVDSIGSNEILTFSKATQL